MIRIPVNFPGGKPLTRRSAAHVVQVACQYTCRIMIEYDQKIVNAKSMLGLLSLGLEDQQHLILLAEGPDEEAAAQAMAQLLRVE